MVLRSKFKKFSIFPVLLSLIFILYLVWHFAWKAKNESFYPTQVNLVPVVEGDLEGILHDFDALLKEKKKTVYRSLNRGLTAEEIQGLEAEYGVKLPPEIVVLYKWHDGCSDFKNSFTLGQIIPGHWFVPLRHALERSRESSQTSDMTLSQKAFYNTFAGYRKSWIMLLDDGCGDGYFYDPARNHSIGYVFYHFAESGRYVFFPSLKNLFQSFIECYQNNVFKSTDKMTLEDFQAETDIQLKYGTSIN